MDGWMGGWRDGVLQNSHYILVISVFVQKEEIHMIAT